MVDYNFIKNVYNIKFDNKKKSIEQYESFINISLLNIQECQYRLNSIELINKLFFDIEFNIKKFIEYLKNGTFIYDEYNEYKRYQKFEEELEDIYYVDDMESVESESYECCRDTELIKKEIKKTKRKIHQEKFIMCIHKLKMFLPNNLIYKIGNFL